MAKLIIKRGSEFMNRMRDLNINLDGKLLGSITNNEIREFEVPSGEHRIQSTIDWCSSPEITFKVQENETKVVEISSFKGGKTLLKFEFFLLPLLFAALFLPHFFDLSPIFSYIIFALSLPPFLFILYKLTFDRKNYLQLHFLR